MFGYVRPVQDELLVRDLDLYRGIYCGMCKYGGKHVSRLTRFFLNYDFVLLALLRMALTGEQTEVKREMCPYKPVRKNLLSAPEAYRHTVSCFALLVYLKNEDDIKDSAGAKKLKARLLRPVTKHIRNRVKGCETLYKSMCGYIDALSQKEKEGCADIDEAADCFAKITRDAAGYGIDGVNGEIASQCGYHLGRFIYLIDALDDLESDGREGLYNPFIAHYGSVEAAKNNISGIKQTIIDSMNAFSAVYGLHESTEFDRIIYNICELGSRRAVANAISTEEKQK